MIDLQLFFPPYSREFRYPELGIPQLTAYLAGKGFSVRQKDLNVLVCGTAAPAAAPDTARFWSPPLKANSRLWNLRDERYPLKAVLKRVSAPSPFYEEFYARHVRPAAAGAALAGFSVLAIDQLLPALYFSARLRAEYPGMKTCLGGPWVSASWDALPSWPELFDHADYLIGFAGEIPLEQLLRHMKGELPLAAVSALARRRGGKVLRSAVKPGPPLEELPAPVLDGFDLDAYRVRCLPYQTTRGCEWGRCVFCYHVFPGNAPASKSPAKILRELKDLSRRHKVKDFYFADLATPVELLESLAAGLGRLKVSWSALARANPKFTPALAGKLRRAGCDWLFFGLETADAKSLRALKKGISLETLDANIRACGAAGVNVGLFILNYPGQPAGEFKDTLLYGLKRADHLAELAVARFEMGRWMKGRPGLGGRLAAGADKDLNSFSLPYLGAGVTSGKFRELAGPALEAFNRIVRSQKRGFGSVHK